MLVIGGGAYASTYVSVLRCQGVVLTGLRHALQVTLVRSQTHDGSATTCGLGIRFREDGEGRLHVEQLTAGGAGKACGELQVGDILNELDGVAMQASLLRGTRMRARRTWR